MKTPLTRPKTRPERRGQTGRGSDADPAGLNSPFQHRSQNGSGWKGSLQVIPSNPPAQAGPPGVHDSGERPGCSRKITPHQQVTHTPWPIPWGISIRCSIWTASGAKLLKASSLCAGEGQKAPVCWHRSIPAQVWNPSAPTAKPWGAALPQASTWGFAGTPTFFTGGLWQTRGPPERHPLLLSQAFLGIGGFWSCLTCPRSPSGSALPGVKIFLREGSTLHWNVKGTSRMENDPCTFRTQKQSLFPNSTCNSSISVLELFLYKIYLLQSGPQHHFDSVRPPRQDFHYYGDEVPLMTAII